MIIATILYLEMAMSGDLIDTEENTRVARPLVSGRTAREYFCQLRWDRDNPMRFMALMGYQTFDNLAGWFDFLGRRN